MSKKLSFVAQFIALVQGNDAEANAIKVQRNATIALKSKLQALEGTKFDNELAVDDSKENYAKILLNNGISDKFIRTDYCDNIIKAKNAIIQAEETLETTKNTIKVLKEALKEIESVE